MSWKVTGKLREAEEKRIEWIIENFLELPNEWYDSPEFSYCGTSLVIAIYPNGLGSSVEWIDLRIVAYSLTAPYTLDYSLHFKTADGKADKSTGFTGTHTFDEENEFFYCEKLIQRSEIIERKSELLPSGILTVICTLKKKGDLNDISGVWKLQQQFKEILENGNVSDVVLKVEDREFKSHRCVLAARSPVFLAMMTHDTKEKNTGVVDIQDVDSNTFSYFLSYLYTGNGEIIMPESVVKLFAAADKYQVNDLRKSCLDYMLKNISVDNFCDILSLSLVHVERDLTDVCSQFFIKNSLAIVKTPKWLMFMKDNLVAGNELYIKHLENNMEKNITLQT